MFYLLFLVFFSTRTYANTIHRMRWVVCVGHFSFSGENLNLFASSGTKLLTCNNYLIDFLPEKGSQWSCMSDFLFRLAGSASEEPAYITVQFDDLYLMNHIVFEGYYDPADVNFSSQKVSPFCYQVSGCYVPTPYNRLFTRG